MVSDWEYNSWFKSNPPVFALVKIAVYRKCAYLGIHQSLYARWLTPCCMSSRSSTHCSDWLSSPWTKENKNWSGFSNPEWDGEHNEKGKFFGEQGIGLVKQSNLSLNSLPANTTNKMVFVSLMISFSLKRSSLNLCSCVARSPLRSHRLWSGLPNLKLGCVRFFYIFLLSSRETDIVNGVIFAGR